MNNLRTKTLAGTTGLAVVFGILVAINLLVSQARLRADFTGEKLYTLSPATRQISAQLKRDVTLKLYYSRSADDVPVQLKYYAQRITDLLREYETAARGHIQLEIIDPKPDTEDEEWAQRYGLTGQQANPYAQSGGIYLGLAAVSGSREAAIPFFTPAMEPQLEYLITRLISEVTTPSKPVIGIFSSLPVMGSPANPFMMGGGMESWVIVNELKNQYAVQLVPSLASAVPTNISTLLLIHPPKMDEASLYNLDQFVMRGGRLIAFVDPLCLSDARMASGFQGAMEASSDLNALTKAWGVELTQGEVVSDNRAGTRVRNGAAIQRNPTWLSLRGDNFNRSEISASSLDFIIMALAGDLRITPVEGLTATPLIQSSTVGTLVNAMQAAMGGEPPVGNTAASNRILAVRLNGTFKSAFPQGKPRTDTPSEDDLKKAEQEAPHIAQSEKETVVIVLADADMLADRFAVQHMNFLGAQVYQYANDNLAFALNAIEQISGNPTLVTLRSRGRYERPFDRVLAMEEAAQLRWQEQEKALEERVQSAQARLHELERAKDPSQRLIISPEQKREIEQFKTDLASARRQLKEVRKNLRGDIEALGLKIKVLNMAAVPALVALTGIVLGLRRRTLAFKR